jgi:hypothetical protein
MGAILDVETRSGDSSAVGGAGGLAGGLTAFVKPPIMDLVIP